ncbi:hypothetical protein TorRG33x02_301720 [Trema orientale]|uniref:Uncharacterized protein n=1 Tax=Trema orientale TaxID=63057 RepID=A0A2P5C0Y5_TREOI|nr:hypothetical protein TorRG33x02_301720 [Trema orientale]
MKQKCIHYKLKRKLLRKMHVEPISNLLWYRRPVEVVTLCWKLQPTP